MFSPNGGQSVVAFHEIDLDLPTKMKIGLTASSISAKPFTATFEKFALLNDVGLIDAKVGDSTK